MYQNELQGWWSGMGGLLFGEFGEPILFFQICYFLVFCRKTEPKKEPVCSLLNSHQVWSISSGSFSKRIQTVLIRILFKKDPENVPE